MSIPGTPEFEQGEVAWADHVAEAFWSTIAADGDEWAPLTTLEEETLEVLLDAVTQHGGVPAAPSAETLAKHSSGSDGTAALAEAERRHVAFRARLAAHGPILHAHLDATVAAVAFTILDEVLCIRAAVDSAFRRRHSREFTRWGGPLMVQRAAARDALLTSEHADRLHAKSFVAPSIAEHPSGDITGQTAWPQYATDDEALRKSDSKYIASVHEQAMVETVMEPPAPRARGVLDFDDLSI